ncbi:MAG: lysophospholipase [Acidimicrobiia bacterium]
MTATTGALTATDGTELYTRSWTIDAPRYDVLHVHGLGEHCGRWDAVAEHFNRNGANVYSYDLRGHGRSGGDSGDVGTFSDFYEDISSMATATAASSGRRWVLYGHSFGGMQSAGYLIKDEEPMPNVAVLSSPWMQVAGDFNSALLYATRGVAKFAPSMRFPVKIGEDQLSKDPAVAEEYFSDPHVTRAATARLGSEISKEMEELDGRLDEITIPTLVFHGADDEIAEPSASAGLAASPGVERKVYPNLRHETHNEPEAAQVLGDMTDWIDAKLS